MREGSKKAHRQDASKVVVMFEMCKAKEGFQWVTQVGGMQEDVIDSFNRCLNVLRAFRVCSTSNDVHVFPKSDLSMSHTAGSNGAEHQIRVKDS